jgi:hypothetical protein
MASMIANKPTLSPFMKSAELPRFLRSSRHLDAEPCRNCGNVYCGSYCNECGQEAFAGAPTTIGFIYEFLTRNIFERGKVPRTLWHLVRYPGGLTVDFLEGRRQRFIRPVRLYFVLSVLYFLVLSVENSSAVKYLWPAPPSATARGDTNTLFERRDANTQKPVIARVGPMTATTNSSGIRQKSNGVPENASFINLDEMGLPKEWQQHPVYREIERRNHEIAVMTDKQRDQTLINAALTEAPKAMFFLVPIFALLLKGLFMLRRIPFGAHLLFAFHLHSYLFLILLVGLLHLPVGVMIALGWSVPLHLLLALRATYNTGWITSVLRSLLLLTLYSVAVAITFAGAVLVGVMF